MGEALGLADGLGVGFGVGFGVGVGAGAGAEQLGAGWAAPAATFVGGSTANFFEGIVPTGVNSVAPRALMPRRSGRWIEPRAS